MSGLDGAAPVRQVAPAETVDVLAEGTVSRRGRSVTHVDVVATADGRPVAKALVTYRLG